jgi:Ser/Thr protein kinase RdoA (MazF antagonist)
MARSAEVPALPWLADYAVTPPVERCASPIQSVNNQCVRVRTGDGDLVWKVYSSHDDPALIRYEHQLLAWLAVADLSFAVPAPLTGRDGETLRRYAGQWHALAPWLAGMQLDPAVPEQVELLGAAVGELLAALWRYPTAPRPGRNLFGALFDFPPAARNPFTITPARLGVASTPANEDLLEWWREEAARLQGFAEGPYRSLPWQVCHNDVAPANILVEAGRVSGVLDFEFAAPAPRALDVAMGLRMTMRVWENPEPWEMVRRFCRGYRRWMPLTYAEVRVLPELLRLRGAISVLWWLGRRATTDDPAVTLDRFEYLRNTVRWLDGQESNFLAILTEAAM